MFIKKILLAFLVVLTLASYGVSKYNYKTTDGFSLSAIQFDLPFNPKWEVSENSAQPLMPALGQKYTYLGKGARSYAFISEDKAYVLKFFKYRYHKPHWMINYLPPVPPFEYYRQQKMQKVSLDTVLSGYKISFDKDPAGTALLYVHLNPSIKQLPTVAVFDKRGAPHSINLNDTRFVLQKVAVEFADVLSDLLAKNQLAKAKERVSEVVELYLSHFRQGMYDLGTGILKNNGFIGTRPVHFDAGKMTLDARIYQPEFQKTVMEDLFANINQWMKKKHPDSQKEIALYLDEKLVQIYGQN